MWTRFLGIAYLLISWCYVEKPLMSPPCSEDHMNHPGPLGLYCLWPHLLPEASLLLALCPFVPFPHCCSCSSSLSRLAPGLDLPLLLPIHTEQKGPQFLELAPILCPFLSLT